MTWTFVLLNLSDKIITQVYPFNSSLAMISF